mmetsp:Transcript_69844/g.221257  ORF Transcript_69844/g.221257 Transcript_69844/m.221257 type:complete len:295 (-) Transcript_69844:34-918(-)
MDIALQLEERRHRLVLGRAGPPRLGRLLFGRLLEVGVVAEGSGLDRRLGGVAGGHARAVCRVRRARRCRGGRLERLRSPRLRRRAQRAPRGAEAFRPGDAAPAPHGRVEGSVAGRGGGRACALGGLVVHVIPHLEERRHRLVLGRAGPGLGPRRGGIGGIPRGGGGGGRSRLLPRGERDDERHGGPRLRGGGGGAGRVLAALARELRGERREGSHLLQGLGGRGVLFVALRPLPEVPHQLLEARDPRDHVPLDGLRGLGLREGAVASVLGGQHGGVLLRRALLDRGGVRKLRLR